CLLRVLCCGGLARVLCAGRCPMPPMPLPDHGAAAASLGPATPTPPISTGDGGWPPPEPPRAAPGGLRTASAFLIVSRPTSSNLGITSPPRPACCLRTDVLIHCPWMILGGLPLACVAGVPLRPRPHAPPAAGAGLPRGRPPLCLQLGARPGEGAPGSPCPGRGCGGAVDASGLAAGVEPAKAPHRPLVAGELEGNLFLRSGRTRPGPAELVEEPPG